jgi:two-component system LytT family response regulator
MKTIRAIVADDQPMARARLAELLSEERDVELVAVCASGAEAIAAIETHAPDLVFLDMQMPELDGFGVIEAIGPARMPSVVFVTAYDEFAVRAFDVHALDYLLKPFGRMRFQRTLDRARDHLERTRAGELAAKLLAVVGEARSPRTHHRVAVRSGSRVVFVDLDQADWIEAEGNYARLHLGAESHLLRETMQALEQRLGSAAFARIHRSRIVNIRRVRELRLLPTGEYEAVLTTGIRLGVSRHYREALQERLKRA